MTEEITPIYVPLPFKLGAVNCYLIRTGAGYVLIDTGDAKQRAFVERELASAGCPPAQLELIVLTHGDADHSGNAAYLRSKFGAKIAMHAADSGIVERGDMFWNRKKPNPLIGTLFPPLFGLSKADRFSPDSYAEDGFSLAGCGLNARILSIPGHSKGSIGILTDSGALFCGDLLINTNKPVLNSMMDDPLAARASVAKLQALEIETVYPGHGQPFPMKLLH